MEKTTKQNNDNLVSGGGALKNHALFTMVII